MTLVTFGNVIVRYVFAASWFAPVRDELGLPTNLLWSLETTVFLFAWLVLLGIGYAVKRNAHLGVDALVNLMGRGARRRTTLLAAGCCIAYALLLLKGAWDYWANFANLPATTGRWFPTGFEDSFLAKGWYETVDIPMPDRLQWIGDYMNRGKDYEKLPRFIPYFALPLGFLLLLIRFVQAGVRVWKGRQDLLIASHEAESTADELSATPDALGRD